ncbi:MAG: bifunctional folylpolyglutamate synthase/dihydrofolate synthase [Verrucomicrobiales bacterium]|jgi:dihydrofolate synthase/folylpolyglutamate synthase|nr:bifunctional folylpolyglutamate synthase/dihydrofolate synthase [Verrucomicrobiales bacterium]
MTYHEAIEWLFGLQKTGVKLGLDNMRRLCRAIGGPDQRLKYIHLAGTNGKGSCAAMLEAILRHAGYKTGLYTSPHLVEFGERIQVNRAPLTMTQVAEQTAWFKTVVERARADGWEPTFFEVVTAMALREFDRQRVDMVVLETGLGGRLDATNIVTPECSVITGIGFDHMEYLGDTLTLIAEEKAAIIKRGRPVVVGGMAEEARRVMVSVAQERGSPLYVPKPLPMNCRLGLAGNYQRANAALALRVCDALSVSGWRIPEESRSAGLAGAEWPGRFQILSNNPLIILDGSHNPQGLTATLSAWRDLTGGEPPRVIFGCLKDKDTRALTLSLDRPDAELWLVPIEAARGESPARLAELFHQAKTRIFNNSTEALTLAITGNTPTLIIGSLYLAGQILAALRAQPHEVKLNG